MWLIQPPAWLLSVHLALCSSSLSQHLLWTPRQDLLKRQGQQCADTRPRSVKNTQLFKFVCILLNLAHEHSAPAQQGTDFPINTPFAFPSLTSCPPAQIRLFHADTQVFRVCFFPLPLPRTAAGWMRSLWQRVEEASEWHVDPRPPAGSWLTSVEVLPRVLGQATVQSLLASVAAEGPAEELMACLVLAHSGAEILPLIHPGSYWLLWVCCGSCSVPGWVVYPASLFHRVTSEHLLGPMDPQTDIALPLWCLTLGVVILWGRGTAEKCSLRTSGRITVPSPSQPGLPEKVLDSDS